MNGQDCFRLSNSGVTVLHFEELPSADLKFRRFSGRVLRLFETGILSRKNVV